MGLISEHISGSAGGVVSISGTVNITNHNDGPGELRFLEDTDLGSYYTGFKASNLTENCVYTLPVAYPTSDKVLQSTDAGVLTWEASGGGGGSSAAITMAGNTIIGHDASKVATNGADNTIIGKDACITMTTGYFNTIIGKGANPSAVGGTNQIVIGERRLV